MADKKPDPKEAAAAAEKKPEVPLTPQELQETKTAILDALWGPETAEKIGIKPEAKEDKKDEPKKEEPAPVAVAKDAADKSDDVKAATETAKPAVKRKGGKKKEDAPAEEKVVTPPVDVEETVRRVLDENKAADAGRIGQDDRARREASGETPLDPQDREILSVIQRMEETNPRYKGLAKQTQDYWKREEQYQTQWEQAEAKRAADEGRDANDFDPDAREHKNWYARNEPKYAEADFKATSERIKEDRIAARAREEIRKEIDPEIQALKRERAEKTHATAIDQSTAAAQAAIEDAVPDDLMEKDANGDLILTENTNPVMYDLVTEQKQRIAVAVAELEKLARMPEHYALDVNKSVSVNGDRYRPHAEIYETFNELERAVATAPPTKQVIDGRRFVTTASKRQAIDQILAGNAPDAQKQAAIDRLNSSTWTIQPDDVRDRLIKVSKSRIVNFAEKAKKWQAARKNGDAPNAETATASNGAKTAIPPAKTAAPPSGATSSASDLQDNAKKMQDKGTSHEEEVAKAMW